MLLPFKEESPSLCSGASSKVINESSTLNDNHNSCFNKIKNIWKSDELNIIYNILIFIENNGPQKEVYIKVIDDIININPGYAHASYKRPHIL